jgi:hypothetical protein
MQLNDQIRPLKAIDEEYFEFLGQLREHAVLHTGVAWLDEKIYGFERPQTVLLDGPDDFIRGLTSMICVEALTNFDRELVFLDGGNSVDLFGIARICRSRGEDAQSVLSRMTVSRAFTAYQFAELVNNKLEGIIEETGASTLVVSSFVDLFLDKDMAWSESFQLMKRSLVRIGEIAAKHELVAVITNRDLLKIRGKRSLRKLMYAIPDRAVVFEERKAGMLVTVPKQGQFFHRYHIPDEQRILDNYGMEDGDGENRAHV